MSTLQQVLHRDISFVRQFPSHHVQDLELENTQTFELRIVEPSRRDRRYDSPTRSEVAGGGLLPSYNITKDTSIVLAKRDGGTQNVQRIDARYDSLHYVLMFPIGDLGWSVTLKNSLNVTVNEFYRYLTMYKDI